jgi:TPR repeat protein
MNPVQLRDVKQAPIILRSTLLFICFILLLASYSTDAKGAESDAASAPTAESSATNWMEAAKAALPERYREKILSFGQLTNLLSQESQGGNSAAQGLWGFALVAQSHSPDEAMPGMELLRSAARNGCVPAMLNLAYVYQNGKFAKTNYSEAFHWFSVAAEKGNADAQAQLGGCYHTGRGTTRDYSKAAKWYRLAADQNNYEAMKSLGFLLLNGLGVDRDLGAAKSWSSRAAKEGNHRRAMFNLGAICILESSNSTDSAASMAEAFRWYKQSADLGDPLACFQVACFYYHGWGGVATNLDSYYKWLSQAANLGASEAEYFMGQSCRTGIGMPKDEAKSLEWYRKAAAKNEPRALYDLAVHYFEDKSIRPAQKMANDYMLRAAQAGHREAQLQYAMSAFRGDVAPPDCERGKQWLAKSAENGWGKAEFLLFQLYYNGKSPVADCPPYPKDTVEAMKWLRRASEHENLQAQSVLAVMLIQGKDVEQNNSEAEKLLRNAAMHGYVQAQNDLGYAILTGVTAKKDWAEAATWCELAETKSTDTNTVARAKVNFANASSQLSAAELSEVDRRVKAFQSIPIAGIDPLAKDWEKNPEFQLEH